MEIIRESGTGDLKDFKDVGKRLPHRQTKWQDPIDGRPKLVRISRTGQTRKFPECICRLDSEGATEIHAGSIPEESKPKYAQKGRYDSARREGTIAIHQMR